MHYNLMTKSEKKHWDTGAPGDSVKRWLPHPPPNLVAEGSGMCGAVPGRRVRRNAGTSLFIQRSHIPLMDIQARIFTALLIQFSV
jgi:hypothetical protein